ncbi:MAG TPA: glycosyl hydrolase [Sedimentisphaerales bacterium]|nr:glycosyl hydrolase [Sedimentisphaerales bacterium]
MMRISTILRSLYLSVIICLVPSISCGQSKTDNALLHKFRNPPREYRPETWYHFLGGAVTREGIDQDVEAINKAGFSALHFFTIDSCSQIRDRMTTPQIPILGKEWEENLTALAKGIKKGKTDLVLHSCPGWAMAGGPWTNIRNSMRTITWSETIAEGPKLLELQLPSPPLDDRSFPSAQAASRGEDADYREIAVLAFPTPKGAEVAGIDLGAAQDKQPFELVGEQAYSPYQKLFNGNQFDSITFPETLELQLRAESPQIIHSVFLTARWFSRLLNPKAYLRMNLYISDDGRHWDPLTVLELPHSCWQTKQCPFVFSIAETRTAHIRIVIKWDIAYGHALLEKPKLGEIRFSSRAQLQGWPALAAYGYRNTPMHPITGGGPGNWVDSAKIIDITDKMQPDGTLQWQAPAGKWTLLRIGHRYNGRKNQPVVEGGSGPEIDKMDAEASRHHYQAYVGRMAGKGGILDGSVKGQLLESWECRHQNWTEKFPSHFKQHHGYEIRKWLPALAGYVVNDPNESWAFLCDFRETIDRLICEQFYGEMARLGHRDGINTYSEQSSGDVICGDPLRHYRYVDIPMTEYWFRGYDDFGNLTIRGCDDFFKPIKNAVSAYRLYGKEQVAAESHTQFGVQWDEHPFMVKTRTDDLFAKGINGVVFHTYAHNPLSDKPGHPMNVSIGLPLNRYQTWWPYMSVWNDYHARSQFMLRQGVAVADILAYVGDDLIRIDDLERLDGLGQSYDFDWINRELLEQVKVKNGSLIIPTGARYQMLYLEPGHSLLPSTLELISNLIERGMTLVGCPPTQPATLNPKENAQHDAAALIKKIWGAKTGGPGYREKGRCLLGAGKVLWGMSLEEALAENKVLPAVETVGTDVPLASHQRLVDGRDLFYLANTVPYARRLVVNLRSRQSDPMIFQALNGSVSRPVACQKLSDGRTQLALDFAAAGSLFIVFNFGTPDFKVPASVQPQLNKLLEPGANNTKVSIHTPMAIPLEWTRRADGRCVKWADATISLKGPWKVTLQSPFEDEKPHTFEMSQLQNLAQSEDDRVKYHSGTATYVLAFKCDADWLRDADDVILDLGNVYNIADVIINGNQPAYGLWAPPFRVNVKDALRAGDNLLTVKVTNAWHNRLLADAPLKPEERRTWSTVYPTGQPRPAGLIGPVRLLAGTEYIEPSN